MFGLENLLDEKDISLPPSRDVWPTFCPTYVHCPGTYVGHKSFLGFHLWEEVEGKVLDMTGFGP